ncbi:MAG: hypothetical protein ACRDKT_13685 [Actinomycetota bacterium]
MFLSRTRCGAILISLLLLSSSCARPPDPLEVGVKEIATDIVLAAAEEERPRGAAGRGSDIKVGQPPSFSTPPVAIGTGTAPEGGTGDPGAPRPAAACPEADPLEAAVAAAPARPTAPPLDANYEYRVEGTYEFEGAVDERGRYPATSTRTIQDVREIDGGYSFRMKDDLGVTTGYSVYPRQRAAEDDPVHLGEASHPLEAGIFVNEIRMKRADDSVLVLDPDPELRIATLPMVRGQKFESTAVDAATGITIRVNGQIGLGEKFDPLRARVDACGTVLEGYWVSYTVDTTVPQTSTTRLFGSDIDLEFAGSRVVFGTQYGGIPLQEIVTIRGSDAGTTVTIRRTSTISSEPRTRS